ncbi:hypothetical protein GCM10007424_00520 [Flavobacterium suaedae]|uniref:Uncharacterized protein n=1 Tax=Flavobacterium suaedae TaxID=1767027 RepID=A0ABQ1JDJ8_9FLAO|nr:hypothetical protein [Flavobacterium suaedae]GGB64519.1 hypothetical protein GCM10007424_00520 [Flavobacterium suaedae]
METKKATILREGDDTVYLELHQADGTLRIALTDNNPNNIKDVFNKLIKGLKLGQFTFELVDDKEDLYHHICVEYLIQLNSEMESVYNELRDLSLLENTQEVDNSN